jgi:hypothetical protein
VGVILCPEQPHPVGAPSQLWRSAIAPPMPPQIVLDPYPALRP